MDEEGRRGLGGRGFGGQTGAVCAPMQLGRGWLPWGWCASDSGTTQQGCAYVYLISRATAPAPTAARAFALGSHRAAAESHSTAHCPSPIAHPHPIHRGVAVWQCRTATHDSPTGRTAADQRLEQQNTAGDPLATVAATQPRIRVLTASADARCGAVLGWRAQPAAGHGRPTASPRRAQQASKRPPRRPAGPTARWGCWGGTRVARAWPARTPCWRLNQPADASCSASAGRPGLEVDIIYPHVALAVAAEPVALSLLRLARSRELLRPRSPVPSPAAEGSSSLGSSAPRLVADTRQISTRKKKQCASSSSARRPAWACA
jgi:hypothetical protein